MLLNDHDLLITHVWGTKCNLKCDFCLNEGYNNLEGNKSKNFRIAEILKKINSIYDDVVYVDHGGELIFCSYFNELMQWKYQNIKNFKTIFFTNGTDFNKYSEFMESETSECVVPFLSYHFEYMTTQQTKEFFKCCDYLNKRYNNLNIALVYHRLLDFKKFKDSMELLKPYNPEVKVFFDFKLQQIDYYKSIKFMGYLDSNFKYCNFHKSELFKSFKEIPDSYLHHRDDVIKTFAIEIECVNNFIRIIDKDGSQNYGEMDKFEKALMESVENFNVRYSMVHNTRY